MYLDTDALRDCLLFIAGALGTGMCAAERRVLAVTRLNSQNANVLRVYLLFVVSMGRGMIFIIQSFVSVNTPWTLTRRWTICTFLLLSLSHVGL